MALTCNLSTDETDAEGLCVWVDSERLFSTGKCYGNDKCFEQKGDGWIDR